MEYSAPLVAPMEETKQRAVCDRYGADFSPPPADSRVGIARQTLGMLPLNGMRIDPAGDECGWYLWAGGEPSADGDFYQPMCIRHLGAECPAAVAFLALPPGWRFLTDGEYVDVWYDATLTKGRGRTRRGEEGGRAHREGGSRGRFVELSNLDPPSKTLAL